MKGNYPSILSLADEVERQEQAKEDYRLSTNSLTFHGNGRIEIAGEGDHGVNDSFHQGVAAKYKIPIKYYRRLQEYPEFLGEHLNSWFHKEPTNRTVRTLDGNARAFLSDHFQPFDNHDMISAAMPVLTQTDLQVKSATLTDERMYVQLVFPKLTGEVKQGDPVQFGITIRNSEVGKGSVSIEAFIYRLICSNGMVGQSLMKKYHVGRGLTDGWDIYTKDTIAANINAFKMSLRDVLNDAINGRGFQDTLAQLQGTVEQDMHDPLKSVEKVTKRFQLTNEEHDQTLRNLLENADTTNRWGLANAITALAHDTDEPDRQYDLERFGSQIITLADKDWEELAA